MGLNSKQGGGGYFNPLTLSPVVWFDSADTNTMFDSTTEGSIVAPGAAIARWEDKSGNARHATQGTVLNRPIRTESGQNGKNAVTFDGVNDRLTFDRVDMVATTLFLVIKRTSSSIYQTPLLVTQVSTTRTAIEFGLNNDASYGPIIIGSNANSTFYGKGGTLGQDSTRIISGKWLGGETSGAANYQIRVNGAIVSLTNSGNVTASNGTFSMIGATFVNSIASSFFGGIICEIIICNANIDTSLVTKTEIYLSKKWGVII